MQWPWQKVETELEREVRHHLESLIDEYEKQGMTRGDAMRKARREFGGVDQIKEECRDESVWSWLTQIGQDVTFGWRMMRKTPAITVAAILSLALGIGATTAILTLADAVLWRTLPVPSPENLVEVLWESKDRPQGLYRGSSGSGFPDGAMRVADYFSTVSYQQMRTALAGKAEVAGHVSSTLASTSFAGKVAVARVRGVTGNFFRALQLQPFEGRLLVDADDNPAAVPVVVVTHRFWSRHLGRNSTVVGQAIRINNVAYSIAGILPQGFLGIVPGEETDIYAPLLQSPQLLGEDSWFRKASVTGESWWMQLIARRAPDVGENELRNLLDMPFSSSWMARPKSPEGTPHIRISEASHGLGSIRRTFGDPVWILFALVSMVLVVACANIANLLLARAVAREKEVALRVSLGCRTGRLMRQFFTESLMLAAMGGALSVGVAAILCKLMINLLPRGFDGMALTLEPDGRSLAATAMVTLLTALLFGLYPAWRASRIDASPALKEGAGSSGTASRRRWVPAKILVLVQVSLGVLLVTASILFTSNLNELVNRDAGFERAHLLLFDLRPGELGYKDVQLRQFYLNLEERLANVPGIVAVGLSRTRPMQGGGYSEDVKITGQPKGVSSAIHHSNSSFLSALGVPIIAGRAVTAEESRSGAKVVVISEDLVKELGLQSPVGARVFIDRDDLLVVGVAQKARYSRMSQSPPVAYVPFDYARQSATIVLRTAIPPLFTLSAVQNVVRDLNRDLPFVDIFTMEQQISRTLQRERLFAWLCGSFGVLALVLCVVGLYGLMSHTTARRTPEIGIRIALGASRGDVMGQVMREGMGLACAGLVLGVPLALYAVNIAEKQKLLPKGDLPYWTLAAAVGVLAASALIAVLSPALRASSVDPMKALRRG